MNPYEVLGVRPTAVIEEIELAYKGRRAQYHPDRYGQLGVETQAWATRMMQQVNEAYRLLSDPGLRSKVRGAESDRKTDSQTSTRPSGERRSGQRDLAALLFRPNWQWFYDNVHVWPNIPRKKAEGAIDSYAAGVDHEEILVLLDDTVFGGAREGVLLTGSAIYAKQKFDDSRHLHIKDIQSVEAGTNSRMIVNGETFFEANFLEHFAIGNFASRLGTTMKEIRR